MDYADLLAGFQTQAQQQNPFAQFGTQVARGPSWGAGFDDPWAALAAGLGQGLVSGAATSYGQSQIEPQVTAFNDYFMGAMQNPQQQLPDVLAEDPYTKQVQAALLLNDRANQAKMQQAKAEQIQDANRELQIEFAKNQNEQFGVSEPMLFDASGQLDAAPVAKPNTRMISDDPSKNTETNTNQIFPEFKSLQDRYNERFEELLQRQVPPTQAGARASAELSGQQKELDSRLAGLSEIRKEADQLESIAKRAAVDVEQAGQTGGVYSSPVGNALSYLWSFVSPEERQQRAATGSLNSLKPENVGAKGSGFKGAMSDKEFESIVSSGASGDNEPQVNKQIINNSLRVAQINKEYTDFVEIYATLTGQVRGVDQLWEAYKKQEPIVTVGPDGVNRYNENRKSWREKFKEDPNYFQNLATEYASGSMDKVTLPFENQTEDVTIKQARNPETGEMRRVKVNASGQIVGFAD